MAVKSYARLDHRVTIQRATYTNSAYGEPIATWADLVTLWAGRTDVSVGEAVRAAEITGKLSAHFLVRYSTESAAITPKDRLRLEGGIIYNILGVRELDRNQWLELHCATTQE